MSSIIFNAVLRPAPDIPVTITSFIALGLLFYFFRPTGCGFRGAFSVVNPL
jgi:hypothetical protein